jgi:hypothetical protein
MLEIEAYDDVNAPCHVVNLVAVRVGQNHKNSLQMSQTQASHVLDAMYC